MGDRDLLVLPEGVNADHNDSVQFVAGNELSISVEEPWAGSTETGFGYRCAISLERKDIEALRDFLNRCYPPTPSERPLPGIDANVDSAP